MNRQMEWYRMYTEARTDAKLRALSDTEHRVWFQLLCFAAEQEGADRGSIIGYDDELLAVEVSNADVALLRVTLNRLRVLRIITEDEDPETGEKAIAFCSFKRRQYDKPSDEPGRVKSRVAAYRARNKQTRNADVTPSNAIDADADTDSETESRSSGKDSSPVDDAVASAAAAREAHWTKAELRNVSKRIAGRLKLTNPDLDGLITILAQYPHAPPYLEAEAAKCVEWYSGKRRKIDIRLYDNWLSKAEQRRRQDSIPLASQNGHHPIVSESEASTNGAAERQRREAENEEERARVAAEMVREQRQRAPGG